MNFGQLNLLPIMGGILFGWTVEDKKPRVQMSPEFPSELKDSQKINHAKNW